MAFSRTAYTFVMHLVFELLKIYHLASLVPPLWALGNILAPWEHPVGGTMGLAQRICGGPELNFLVTLGWFWESFGSDHLLARTFSLMGLWRALVCVAS